MGVTAGCGRRGMVGEDWVRAALTVGTRGFPTRSLPGVTRPPARRSVDSPKQGGNPSPPPSARRGRCPWWLHPHLPPLSAIVRAKRARRGGASPLSAPVVAPKPAGAAAMVGPKISTAPSAPFRGGVWRRPIGRRPTPPHRRCGGPSRRRPNRGRVPQGVGTRAVGGLALGEPVWPPPPRARHVGRGWTAVAAAPRSPRPSRPDDRRARLGDGWVRPARGGKTARPHPRA